MEAEISELGSGMGIGVLQRLIGEEGHSHNLKDTGVRNGMSLLLPALFHSHFFSFAASLFLRMIF